MCVFIEIISESVKSVKLSLHKKNWCGGENVQIHLIQGDWTECKTEVIDETHVGQSYYFGLGTCGNTSFHAERPSINFKIITTDKNDFCPKHVTIGIGERIFQTELAHYWHDNKNNNKLYTANRIN